MDYIIQIIVSFIATACFGIIFNVPIKRVFFCGIVGAMGWIVYYVSIQREIDPVQASFLGAFAVAIAAHVLAKKYKTPMIVFNVSGIIPLVPGGIAYNAMRSAVENDYLMSIQYGSKAFMISGAIAMGLAFAEVLMQLIFRARDSGRSRFQHVRKKHKRLL